MFGRMFLARVDPLFLLLAALALDAAIEGVFITTRAGFFEVAEACSGVNFQPPADKPPAF